MKPVTQLVAASLLAFSCLAVGALTGCSAPTIPTDTGDGTDDADQGDSAQTGKLPPKKTTDKTNNKPAPTPDPAPAADPAPTTPTPTTPTPGGDPQACMAPCAAAGPAAQYWTCSANCQDQACDDKCWSPTCGQNAQTCESALDTCASQCGLNAGP